MWLIILTFGVLFAGISLFIIFGVLFMSLCELSARAFAHWRYPKYYVCSTCGLHHNGAKCEHTDKMEI